MPRPERSLPPDDGALQRLAADLRRLREAAGGPGYRELARRAHYSATTLSEAAAGKKLPSLAVTLAYVQACGGDTAEWETRWHSVAAELASAHIDAAATDDRCPYVGLASFQVEDADRFFGRESIIAELVGRVRAHRFTAVFGPSGSGKSSLLRAGLIPAINADGQVIGPWPSVLFTPGDDPLQECAIQLGRLLGIPAGAVLADLQVDPHHLHLAVRQALADQPPEVDLLMVVDQFEEVFTLCDNTDRRAQFIAALLAAAQASTSRVRVVLGVRADFYGRCAEHPDLVQALQDSQTLLGAMHAEQLRAAITQPAARAGLAVEATLVASIISEMIGRPGALPLMSHALVETWRRRRGTTLTLAGYQAAGELQGALVRTAERAYAELDDRQQDLAREVFLRLTAVGESADDTRRPIARTELAALGPATTEVIDLLADARLLTVGEDTVEIAHEALIRAWPRLRDWLAADRDGLRIHRHLTTAVYTWQSLGRDPGALYRGLQLAQARDWDTHRHPHLTRDEREFLDASITAHTREQCAARRRTRRLRSMVACMAVVACLAMAAGAVALQQRQDALQQRQDADHQRALVASQELAGHAATLTGTQPDAAMMVALAAFQQAETPDARSALLSAQAPPSAITLPGPTTQATHIVFSPTGHLIAVANHDGTVALRDPASGQLVASLGSQADPVDSIAFTPDGRTLAAATHHWSNRQATVTLWDVASHLATATLAPPDQQGGGMGVAFSPDGQQLAVAAGNIVTLWDPTSRHIITTLTSSADPLLADRAGAPLVTTSNVAYSSDGHHLASTTTYATVTLWDTTTGQASVLHPVDIPAEVLPSAIQIALRFSPDGRTLATGDSVEGTILWDTATGHLISRLSNSPTAVEAVAFSPTEPLLAVTSTSGDTQLWELPSDRHTTTLSSEDHTELGHVIDIAFSPTDPTLATVGEDGTIRLWNINGNALSAHPLTALHGLAISPDGTTLATGNAEGTVTLWNTTTHHQTAVLTGHTGAITSVAFSPDGHALASASADHTAVMWNLATQARTVTFREPGPVQEVLFSRNGRVLAMGTSDGTIDIREVATGAAAVSPPASVLVITALAGLALGPDGQTVAVAGSGANTPQPPALQYLTSGEAASIMAGSDAGSHHSSASRAAFSTDGRTAAVARDDGTVQLLDANNGIGQTAIVTGHSGAVTGVAFSPDDQTLAIASADGSVILWDIASNQPVATLTGHAGSVNGVVFSPRGQSLATIGDDGTARLWDLNANHVISQLCRSIASNSDSPHQQVQLTPDLSAHANCR